MAKTATLHALDDDATRRSKDRATFVRLANKRVPNAVKAIELVGNLSTRTNYHYTDADAKAVIKALKSAVAECEARFGGKVADAGGFVLE